MRPFRSKGSAPPVPILLSTTLTRTLLITLITLLTLIGIMTRPFKWNEALIALAGAILLLILGLINPVDAFVTLLKEGFKISARICVFFVGRAVILRSDCARAAGIRRRLAV